MMGNLTSQLARVCNACGIEKPLSAFLQLSGAHGTSYGKVCAKCRAITKAAKPVSTATDEERSTEPSGAGIRGKEKIYAGVKRDQKILTLKELYRKEDLKKQEITDKKMDRASLKEAAEKKHRDFYIAPQKKTILAGGKTPALNQQTITRQQTEKLIGTRIATEHHKATLETKKQQHVEIVKTLEKEEAIKTSTNFNNLFHAIEPGRIDMNSALIKNFFTYLGHSAPIVQTLARATGFAATDNKPRRELTAAESTKNALTSSHRNRS